VQFSIDGIDLVVSDTPIVYSSQGATSIAAADSRCSVTVGFSGSGIGGFSSNPEGGRSVRATAGEPRKNFSDSYNEPCTAAPRWLTTSISVGHANKERQFIVGSFNGSLSIQRGMTMCNGSPTDDFVVLPLTGAFVARWVPD
jgi:hypothetical protein